MVVGQLPLLHLKGSAPKKVKLFVNFQTLGFSEAEDYEPTQEFELSPEDVKEGGKPITLQTLKFQKTDTLTVSLFKLLFSHPDFHFQQRRRFRPDFPAKSDCPWNAKLNKYQTPHGYIINHICCSHINIHR